MAQQGFYYVDIAAIIQHVGGKVAHIDSLGDKPQRGLLKKLELAIIRSDSALMDTARLVGVKPSCGLYTKIKEILVVEEDLDPHTDLWRLLGVDP